MGFHYRDNACGRSQLYNLLGPCPSLADNYLLHLMSLGHPGYQLAWSQGMGAPFSVRHKRLIRGCR
jgi:hypothetical protein